MHRNVLVASNILLFALVGLACGPNEPEIPQPSAAAGGEEPVPEDKAEEQQHEGTHTMPDGTTMEGHTHGEQESGE